jgi:polyisoprenoid-binding protein YceI
LAVPFLAACGAQAQPAGLSGSEPNVAAQPSAAAGAGQAAANNQPVEAAGARGAAQPAGTVVFTVVPDQSKAIFRVREQLARVNFPSDAEGSTGAVNGQIALRTNPAGVVSDASKITVDLRTLATDSNQRDSYIKRNTLQTDQYPTAEFVPTKAEGLPSPLPESGEHSFKLTGLMTVHGVQKEVTWDATTKREGSQLTGTATTTLKFGDFGMEPPKVPVVLSVVDEIRLELGLVANAAA